MNKMDWNSEEETTTNPVSYVGELIAAYGWFVLGTSLLVLYLVQKLRPRVDRWRQEKEDAEYHKDPDRVLARMEAIQKARDEQQKKLLEASQRALEHQKEREERKRAELEERLKKYGAATSAGNKLGAGEDYMPLSGGASTSSYKPPKRSACSKGGCGK